MVRVHFLATLAPALLPLLVVYGMWPAIEEVPQVAVLVVLLASAPLLTQLGRWGVRGVRSDVAVPVPPAHPFGLVLPLGLLLVLPLWPVGEWVARQVPSLCETTTGERVPTSRPGTHADRATFFVHFHGRGNRREYEFRAAVVVYSGPGRKFEDMYVHMPEMRGHYTNSYTTFFPVTRDVVVDYVRRSDDFPPQEAAAVGDQLWALKNRYSEKRDMPPEVGHFYRGDEPRIVSYVPGSNTFLGTGLLALLFLAAPSWVLARRYGRRLAAGIPRPQGANGLGGGEPG